MLDNALYSIGWAKPETEEHVVISKSSGKCELILYPETECTSNSKSTMSKMINCIVKGFELLLLLCNFLASHLIINGKRLKSQSSLPDTSIYTVLGDCLSS